MTAPAAPSLLAAPACFFSAATVAVGLPDGFTTTASAASLPAAQNVVGASTLTVAPFVGLTVNVFPAMSRVSYDSQAQTASATGVIADTVTGLTYLSARYYDPLVSRFISPDPLMNPMDPKTLDAYMYAGNNPIAFRDPSGLNMIKDPGPWFAVQEAALARAQAPGVRSGRSRGTVGDLPGLSIDLADFATGANVTPARPHFCPNSFATVACISGVERQIQGHQPPPWVMAVAQGGALVFICVFSDGVGCLAAGEEEGAGALAAGSADVFAGETAADVASSDLAASLATKDGQAVFWTGFGDDGSTAAAWTDANGGVTVEQQIADSGAQVPGWDSTNPAVVAKWKGVSQSFAQGAGGDLKVLVGPKGIQPGSMFDDVEKDALVANPRVTSITAVNPATGEETVLWTRP